MNGKKAGKTIFAAGTLLLLLLLAVSSMISFAKSGARSSYTLTIVKKLDISNFPENTDLGSLSYNFNITGTKGGGADNPPVSIDEKVTIDNFKKIDDTTAQASATIELGASSAVSVIELTNTLDPDLIGYGVSGTSYTSHMHVNNGYAEVTLSKEKNWLTISPSKPADGVEAIERFYRVTKPDGSTEKQLIKDGESWELKNLPAGNYIIEAIKAPDGFSMELEDSEIPINAGEKAEITINGPSGSVTLKAGGTPGDGKIHYFTAKKDSDSSFPEENFSLASGETYQRDHLTAGKYILEAATFEGTPAFSVSTSYGADEEDSGYFTVKNPKRGSFNYATVNSADPSKGDFVRVKLSGITPTLASGYTAAVYTYTGRDSSGNRNPSLPILKRNATNGRYEEVYSNGNPSASVSLSGIKSSANSAEWPSDTYRIPFSSNKQFGVGFPSVKANPDPLGITSFRVDWTLYRPDTLNYESEYGNIKTVRVYKDAPDYRSTGNGWLEISKEPDTNEQILQHVHYKYTITNKSTGAKYTATLGGRGGEWSTRLGLPTGSYTVEQEMVQNTDAQEGFTISIKDKQYTTDKKASITAKIMGTKNTIKLEKPPASNDPDREYRPYRFSVSGTGFPNPVTVALDVNKPTTLRALLIAAGIQDVPGEDQGYQKGTYTITPLDDDYVGFDLDYSDSCTVAIVGSPATVTITNTYDKVDGSYRVVHEYYADDDMTTLDGISEISQFTAPVHSLHTENKVTRVPTFTGNAGTYFYEYKEAGYGDYGRYDTAARTVSGNSPELILEEDIENSDVSENNPDRKEQEEAIPDAENPDGPPSDEESPDGSNSDVEHTGGQIADPSAPEGQDPNTGDPDQQNFDTIDVDAEASEETAPVAELSVTGISRSEKYHADIADGRTLSFKRSHAAAVEGHSPGSRYPVGQTYNSTIPMVRSIVSEKPDTENPDRQISGNDMDAAETAEAEAPSGYALTASDGVFIDDGSYTPNKDYNEAQATVNGDKIIILRYVRRGDIPTTGSYKIVHRYYLRDSHGDHLEGAVRDNDVTGLPLDYREYQAGDVPPDKLLYSPGDGSITHTYTHDSDVYGPYTDGSGHNALHEDYQPASGKTGVYATPNGDEVIVRRYVRTISYNVVHEYYLRTPMDSTGAASQADAAPPNPVSGIETDISAHGKSGSDISGETDDGNNSGDTEEDGGGNGDSEGSTEISYQYDYEGRTQIQMLPGNLNETYTEARVKREVGFRPQSAPAPYNYTPYAYAYGELASGSERGYTENPSMTNATATVDGDQVIILKYYRVLGSEPDPDPPSDPNPGGGHDPDPDPDPKPELVPEPEPEPELPTELPDPNDPDSPDKITIIENGVPRTYVKVWDPQINEWIYIPEEEVPLWGSPPTGDNSPVGLPLILSAASFSGILFLWADKEKKTSRRKRY